MAAQIYDAVIIGGGPAGLSSAIYLARAKYSVLVIEKETFGGQITITSEVVNYPGVLEASGKSLTEVMRKQAENFGASFKKAEVKELKLDAPLKTIVTDQGEIQAVGIVLAVGASPRRLGFKGEDIYRGRGIAYCATCDGEFFEGCELFVIGGGFAACEESIFLTQYASKVTMIVREEDFTCAKTIADQVREHPKIETIFETEIVEAGGDDQLRYAVFRNNKENTLWRHDTDGQHRFGIFVFAGYVPANDLFKDQLKLDEQGYLVTDRNQKTSVDGVYGAGDICVKPLRQVVTAVGDGAIAATSLEKYISETKIQHHIETIEAKKPVPAEKHEVEKEEEEGFLSAEIKAQLQPILARIDREIYLSCYLGRDDYSLEMKNFASEFTALCKHIHLLFHEANKPYMEILDAHQKSSGVAYHMVPGGHEFNSFVLGIYNAGTDGQPLSAEVISQIRSLPAHQVNVFVSLSCTMCPEVVQAVQRIALENEHIQADIYDLAHHPEYKEKYNIMSVPCVVIDDTQVVFGKKSLEDMIAILA